LVTAGGMEVYVAHAGQGARPVLMIHCSLARHESLLGLAGLLPDARVTLFDLPGHGRSAAWDGLRDYQQVCVAVAADVVQPGSHVIGHSFGATVALRLAVERPDLVARLTLIEPVFFAAAAGTPEHAAHARDFALFVAALQAGDRDTAARVFHGLWGAGDWDALKPRSRDEAVARIDLVVAGAAAIEQDAAGILPRLAGVQMPVTLVRGAMSPPVIGAVQAALAGAMPQARQVVIAGAGHMVPVTHAVELAAVIERG